MQICRSEQCQSKGSPPLEKHVKTSLRIDAGQSTKGQIIYLEPGFCLRNCACLASVRIDDDIHARVTPDSFDNLISDIKLSKTHDKDLAR